MTIATVDEVLKMTITQLKSYAKKNNIDLFGVHTKEEIIEVILCFIPKNGETKKDPKKKEEKIALYSLRNLHWNGVGRLEKGYNIVSKEASEMWISKSKAVRLATPQEVSTYYGKS